MPAARILAGSAIALTLTASACSSWNNGVVNLHATTTSTSTTPTTAPASTTTSTIAAPTTTVATTPTSGSTTSSTLFIQGAVPAVGGATDLTKEPTISPGGGTPPTVLTGKDLVVGTGATAAEGDSVSVQYVGAFYQTGKDFDASWTDGNGPLQTTLTQGQTITGFEDAIIGMKVGGRREIVIPPSDGYGDTAQGPIPANSTLVFVIDLVSDTPS